ncbi:MAG: helix-turn-helix domain-containing protein [Eggerthellaceae bacterium]|nr:helix-turn-helix domain-containing protein [Eggerthellaceae bacterium]
MEVGKNIRDQRESAGISQEELARRIFVSRQTVSNWETGKTYPDVQSLLLLSNLFGVSVDSLVKGDVEAMSKEIENYELERFKVKAGVALSWVLIVVGMLMSVLLVTSEVTYYSPLYFLAIGIMMVGLVPAFWAQRIEDRRNIKTIAEVKAFLDGAEPDSIPRKRKLPGAMRVALQMALGAAAGIALMALFLGLARFIGLP